MLIFKVIHLQLRMRPLCIAFFFPLLMFFPPCTFCFLILTINVELNALHILGSASQSHLSYCTMYSVAFIQNSFPFLKHLSCHHHNAFAYDNLTTFAWWYKQIIQVLAPMKLPQTGSDLSGQIFCYMVVRHSGLFSSKSTGVGCHFLLQETFWTQGSNPLPTTILHYRWSPALQADSLLTDLPGKP